MPADRRVASIGDPDLDFDVTTIMRPVLRYDSPDQIELMIECDGGIGGWDSDGSGLDELDCVNSISIGLGYRLPADIREQPEHRAAMDIIDRLVHWGEIRATVRIVCAPGKFSTLYGPDNQAVYLPRTQPSDFSSVE